MPVVDWMKNINRRQRDDRVIGCAMKVVHRCATPSDGSVDSEQDARLTTVILADKDGCRWFKPLGQTLVRQRKPLTTRRERRTSAWIGCGILDSQR